jgi:hypothetical protein
MVLAGGVAAWLLAARAAVSDAPFAAALREGLKDAGHFQDRNVAIEYRSGEEVFLTARVA